MLFHFMLNSSFQNCLPFTPCKLSKDFFVFLSVYIYIYVCGCFSLHVVLFTLCFFKKIASIQFVVYGGRIKDNISSFGRISKSYKRIKESFKQIKDSFGRISKSDKSIKESFKQIRIR